MAARAETQRRRQGIRRRDGGPGHRDSRRPNVLIENGNILMATGLSITRGVVPQQESWGTSGETSPATKIVNRRMMLPPPFSKADFEHLLEEEKLKTARPSTAEAFSPSASPGTFLHRSGVLLKSDVLKRPPPDSCCLAGRNKGGSIASSIFSPQEPAFRKLEEGWILQIFRRKLPQRPLHPSGKESMVEAERLLGWTFQWTTLQIL